MLSAIWNFIFSGFFNFVFSICFIIFLFVLPETIRFIIKRLQGHKIIKYGEVEKNIEDDIKFSFKFFIVMIIFYLLGNGFHTPSESMKIYEQKEIARAEEKIQNEERKKQEQLEKEKKKAEQQAEKERQRQENEHMKQQEKIDKENADKNNHDFIEISAQNLMNELEANAARANKNFNGKYVKITNAIVTNIDSDGDYINVNDSNIISNIISLTSIQCSPKYESTKEQIFNLNNGQTITVYGKIKDVGEIIGYYVELLKIE